MDPEILHLQLTQIWGEENGSEENNVNLKYNPC